MAIVLYDNLFRPLSEDALGLLEVERIYCFEWSQFTEMNWLELDSIYRTLPGSVRYHDIPWWFGDSEASPPFLSASVEPPGLQVYGVVGNADWSAWDEQFCSAAANLPMRVLS